jgi:putative ABC transport system substrate-binding protein
MTRRRLIFIVAFLVAAVVAQAQPATNHSLPVVSIYKDFAEAGGLLAYGPNLPAAYRRAAYYADRILKGAKPSDLPVEEPTQFDLVVNLKTAKALGLTIPPSVCSAPTT